jgi:Ca-activated chloride channel family protein
VRVEIDLVQPLPFARGEAGEATWEYRFPTVAGVRYHGDPGRVPDAEALTPPRADDAGTPVRLDLELTVGDGEPATLAPCSPSHALDVSAAEGGTAVRLIAGARLDRDVVVRWRATGAAAAAHLTQGAGLTGDGGRYGLLTVTPPTFPAATLPRDLTVLLDSSGSMSGAPLAQARRVVRALLESLGETDRFELLAFASRVEQLTAGLVPADRRREALDRLERLEAGGGTEMAAALFEALHILRADSQRQVVLVTDGCVGFEREIVAHVLDHLPAGARLHVVGVGSSPNRTLTSGASRAGRGVELLVGLDEDGSSAAADIVRATAAPVLTEVEIRGSAVLGVAPERARDVFAGRPLLAALELRPEGGTLEVQARLASQSAPWTARIEVEPAAGTEGLPPLGALYGRERVRDCEMRGCAAADQEDRAPEIEALGLRHRIVTPHTSLVAVSEDPTVDPADPRRRERLAVELPYGVSAEGVGLGRGGREVASMFSRCAVVDSRLMRTRSMPSLDMLAWQSSELSGRVVRIDRDLLVIELESFDSAIELPEVTDEVVVVWDDGDESTARVEPASTRPGRHAAGLTLRLVLRLSDAAAERRTPLRVRWRVGGRWHAAALET